MGADARLFGSRVARQVFVAFVVAGLVPIGAMAVLAFFQVGSALEARAVHNLAETSRNAAQHLFERLALAEESLRNLGDNGSARSAMIDAAYLETPNGIVPIEGNLEPISLPTPSRAGTPMLVPRTGANGVEILLALRFAGGTLVGRVASDRLWTPGELLPYGLNLCVFAPTLVQPLYCDAAAEVAGELRAVLPPAADASFYWDAAGEEQLSSQRELFLPSRYDAAPWTVVVSQPAAVALDSLAAFNWAFGQALLLSAIVVALLSARQIRRILEPLSKLVAGTRRIGERDFGTRVALNGKDEFSELGAAMNDMVERLGRQFATLTALSELDSLILSSRSIDHVLEMLFARVDVMVPGCKLAAILVDPDERTRAHLYMSAEAGEARSAIARIELTPDLAAWLLACAAEPLVRGGDIASWIPALPVADPERRVAVMPMIHEEQLRGAIVGEFVHGIDTAAGGEVEMLREFAGRICVALSAIDREQELFMRGHFDSLTGLPNRQLCHDRLQQAIAHARRGGYELAVLFIDLDRFKDINDSLGHSAGDELLRETSVRIASALRDDDTLARLGGDEYVVVLPQIHGPLEADIIAERIVEALKKPFKLGQQESFVGASVGVTIYPRDGATVEELLRRADTAMYAAKESGRGRRMHFSSDMDERAHERLALQSDLRGAIAQRQLEVMYQPQIELRSGRLVGAEALLRWNHPHRGPISPVVFVPILEETGLIEQVGEWVLETALAEFVKWRIAGVALERIAVNAASRQVLSGGFPRRVAALLDRFGLKGSDLEIELTESTLVSDFARVNEVFRELRGLGVRIAIDDFGTGYSSLAYLQELVFDILKIDRAFVCGLPNKYSKAIIQSVVTVAHALDKEVVAEGVELPLQRDLLHELGCDLGQGYLFSHAMDAATLARNHEPLGASGVRRRLPMAAQG